MEVILKRLREIIRAKYPAYINGIFALHESEDLTDYGGSIYKKIPDDNIEYIIGETDIIPTGLTIQIIGNSDVIDPRGYSQEDEVMSVTVLITASEDIDEKAGLRVKRYARAMQELLKDYLDLRSPSTGRDPLSKGVSGKVSIKYYPAIPNDTEKERMVYWLQSASVGINYIVHSVVLMNKYSMWNKDLA